MSEFSTRFNFDDFQGQIDDALDGEIYLTQPLHSDLENQVVEFNQWLVDQHWQTEEQSDAEIRWWKDHHHVV